MIRTTKIATVGLLAASFFSPAARANSLAPGEIVLYQGSPSSVNYSYTVGGEFTAVTDPDMYASYASSALATVTVSGKTYTGFQTFCIQTGVDFTPGTTYKYSTSLASIGSPDAFALSEGAAWLYSQFAQGTLANYDFLNSGNSSTIGAHASRTADAGALQAAIWTFQGGQSYPGFPSGDSGNIYYTAAINALSGEGIDPNAAVTASTDFGVEVLNISTDNGTSAQNQLVYLPDGGSTLALFAGGLTALGALAIKSRRSPGAALARATS